MIEDYQKIDFKINGVLGEDCSFLISSECQEFLVQLYNRFAETRRQLLKTREEIQLGFNKGKMPNFLEETKGIRESSWKILPLPEYLQDRRVEIT
ncbi:Malate synthase A, partial [mine drainage metagenome]